MAIIAIKKSIASIIGRQRAEEPDGLIRDLKAKEPESVTDYPAGA
jgi:hypothetical protein